MQSYAHRWMTSLDSDNIRYVRLMVIEVIEDKLDSIAKRRNTECEDSVPSWSFLECWFSYPFSCEMRGILNGRVPFWWSTIHIWITVILKLFSYSVGKQLRRQSHRQDNWIAKASLNIWLLIQFLWSHAFHWAMQCKRSYRRFPMELVHH